MHFLDIHRQEQGDAHEMPESCWCCRCVFQLSGNVQLPQGTTHLCDYSWGRPQEQLVAAHPTSSPHPCWAVTGRAVLSRNFPGWLKDQQVLSPWGQGCESSQDQGQGAWASCRHTACLCAASWSPSVAEPFGCFLVPSQGCEASEGTVVH